MNRRGFILNLVEIFSLVMLLAITIVAIIYLVASIMNFSADSFKSEAGLMATNIIYSPGGLSFEDKDLGRLYPGLIDVTKVTSLGFETELAESFNLNTEDNHMGVRITLYDSSGRLDQSVKVTAPSAKELERLRQETKEYQLKYGYPYVLYLNTDFFEKWRVLAKTNYKGPGSARARNFYFNVNTLHDDGLMYNGVVHVEVVGRG